MIGLGLTAAIWGTVEHRITEQTYDAEIAAYNKAEALANSYAQQLRHTVEQIDQLTLRLKYDWEDRKAIVDLERDRIRGLFPESQFYASIIGPQGDIETTTLNTPRTVNVSSLPAFKAHEAGCCDDLLITKIDTGRVTKRPVVRFSRRLSSPAGEFGGVVLVTVEPSYVVSFQEDWRRGKNDFISARLASGALIATKYGNLTTPIPIFYKDEPVFQKDSGVEVQNAERFIDGEKRIVAWRKLANYPLVAIAALSRKDALAETAAEAKDYRKAAAFASLLVLTFSVFAAYLSIRLSQKRRQADEATETYRTATDAANEGFFTIRPIVRKQGYIDDFLLEDCNHRGASLLGLGRSKLRGVRLSKLKHEALRDELFSLCTRGMEKGFFEEEIRVPLHSPMKATWLYRRIVFSGAGLALTIRDISDAKAHEQALSDLANSDGLTKLPNRHWLASFLPAAIDRAARRMGYLSVLFIDLDDFKNINNTLGHDSGDDVLLQATTRLKETLRSSDHVVRIGGDEFVVVLEHTDSADDAERVARSLISALAQPYVLFNGNSNRISASIGISVYPRDGDNAEVLLKHADIAMYAAKFASKGGYRFYEKQLSDALHARLDKEAALRRAVEQDEFVVYYQPRVDTFTGTLSSMEALVRWNRPGHGLVPPGEFIQMAEDTGLIVRLGELVIEKTVAQIAAWRREGKRLVPVSVNVSPQQLREGTVSAFFEQALRTYQIDSSLLEVELTESAVVDRSQVVCDELGRLRRQGLKLMVDDFGTGYSSLAQLHRLDVDVLKVDRAFTTALSEGSEGEVLFRAIVSMANALDIDVVAEGVETVEQLHILKSLNCAEIQGYIVSEPLSADQLPVLMRQRSLLPVAMEAFA